MVFNSLVFVVFFAWVFAVHRSPLSWRTRKGHLLVASYVFYGAWSPPFVLLLWFSTVADWHLARAIDRASTPRARWWWLVGSLGVNLGLLGYFKYADFFVRNLAALDRAAGGSWHAPTLDIVLPVGISFYTFQTLSYTLDVYLRRSKPWHSFLDYALYVTFFPQLVAGPIVRADAFLGQCETERRASGDQVSWGLTLVVLGLFQKIVLADGVFAPAADAVFAAGAQPDFCSAWGGTLAFAGQIFCDFAGYSTCAIGTSLALGFHLGDNFRFPYAAVGFSDFWRRWHISLSTWFRDYVFFPLSYPLSRRLEGVRWLGLRDDLWTYGAATLVTMLLCGLWHGASWSFVVWGGLHGVFLVAERLLRRALGEMALWRRRSAQVALQLLTFALTCLTWVFFRAGTLDAAVGTLGAMTGLSAGRALAGLHLATALSLALVGVHVALGAGSLESFVERVPWWARGLAVAAMLLAIVTAGGDERAFIYFRF